MNEPEIEKWRLQYQTENTPDEQLIAAVQRFPTREHGIAAQQVLVARQRAREQQTSEEARLQHRASFALGSRTLTWTIVAAIAAIVGAVLTAAALLLSPNTPNPKTTTAASTSSPGISTPKSVSPAPAASSSNSKQQTPTPAGATPLPKTP